LSANNFRQSYTLRFHTIHELAVLAAWENRTPSQQVDYLINQSFVAYREALDPERRAALDADVLAHTGGV
jgi:hypothetical protein